MPGGSLTIHCSFEISCDQPQEQSAQAMLSMQTNMETDKNTLTQNISSLQGCDELSDVQLICNGVTFKCPKLILAARSDVFKAMFSRHEQNYQENQTNTVNIVDSTADAVRQLVNFIYTDDCQQMKEQVSDLLPLADKYNIPRLKLKCEKYLADNISVRNAAKIIRLADMHNSPELFKVAQNFVLLHMDSVKNTQYWKRLMKTHPHIAVRLLESMPMPSFNQSECQIPSKKLKTRPGPKCKKRKQAINID